MAEKKAKLLGNSLNVQGTKDIDLPHELSDYFTGKGTPAEFLKKHYGFGKGMTVEPRAKPGESKMTC